MPWWSSWNTACCASVPVPPQVTGAVGRVDRLAVGGHRLAVRFHLELLEIEGQQPQPLVIGEHARASGSRASRRRDGRRRRRAAARSRAGSAKRKWRSISAAPSSNSSNASQPSASAARHADRAPQRIAPADAFAERQDAGLVDARLDRRFGLGGDRDDPAVGIGDARPRAASRAPRSMLASVSAVVKVFEATTTRVVAGSSVLHRIVERRAVDVRQEAHVEPRRRRPSASTSSAGPSTEPPMPMCRTPVTSPNAPPRSHRPARACAAGARRRGRRRPARRCRARRHGSPARPSLGLTISPGEQRVARRGEAHAARRASTNCVDQRLVEMGLRPVEIDAGDARSVRRLSRSGSAANSSSSRFISGCCSSAIAAPHNGAGRQLPPRLDLGRARPKQAARCARRPLRRAHEAAPHPTSRRKAPASLAPLRPAR